MNDMGTASPSPVALEAHRILETTTTTPEEREEAAIALGVILLEGGAVAPTSLLVLGRELFFGELARTTRWRTAEVLSLHVEPVNTALALQVLHDADASEVDVEVAARLLCGADHLQAVRDHDFVALARQIDRLGLQSGVATMLLDVVSDD